MSVNIVFVIKIEIMFKKIILFALIISLIISCKHKSHNVIRSFCYWKTNLIFNGKSDTLVDDLEIKHFYVRFFDVDWNPYKKQAQPIASIKYIDFNETKVQITPSIYITNDVVLNANKMQLDSLSENISNRINKISENYFAQAAERFANKIAYNNYEKQTGETKKFMDILPILTKKKTRITVEHKRFID
ncbi:MAG: hypothetical protein H7174_08775 [Flavobacterium sp.]|nr:hypothetical protein [Flavobacterium sp.]